MEQVNYIAQLNAFDRWLETNYLPAQSQLLWYKLIALFNRCGWCEWITVDNQRMMALIQVKREATFIDLRNCLIDKGLVNYQKGKKGSPNRYKMNFFTFTSEVKTVVNPVAESEVQTGVETVDINKLNQTKPNQTDSTNLNTTTPTVVDVPPDVLCGVVAEFTDKIRSPKPGDEETLRQLCELYTPRAVNAAIAQAAGKGRSVNYLKPILANWRQNGTPPAVSQEPGRESSYNIDEYEKSSIFDDLPPGGEKAG